MKSGFRIVLWGVAVTLLSAGLVFAGMNPTTLGIPSISPADAGYNTASTAADNVNGKIASVLCVGCHSRNPGWHNTADGQTWANSLVGSHWVTDTFADTSTFGMYTDSRTNRVNGKYLHRGPWKASGNSDSLVSTGNSKYGVDGGTAVDNVSFAAAASITDNTAQIICESCHNILRNIGPNKLLAAAFANATAADNGARLCTGCHGDMRSGINNESAYFSGVADPSYLQDHHRNSMETDAEAYYTGTSSTFSGDTVNMGTIAASYYTANTDNGSRMWAVGPGNLLAPGTASRAMNVASAVDITDGLEVAAGSVLHCNNCHRAHNAASTSGSLALQLGNTSTRTYGYITSFPSGTTSHDGGDAVLQRQRDVGSPKNATTKLLKDDQGLCGACHSNK